MNSTPHEARTDEAAAAVDVDGYGLEEQAPPSAGLRALDRLVGTWRVTGGAEGEVTYEWMEGGYFLLQRVRLVQFGQEVAGLEVIGNLHPFGEPVGDDVVSRFYDSLGNTLDYVYELAGDRLTIWAGAKGGPAYFEGLFDADGDSVVGEWVYPGGGGYASTMTRR
ncbi:hypothetical protein ACFP63_15720 [Oerskovia jenensis]|uniref:DUF1579 domain-containing protein n=1 Tax=Oerskovia jenensis TaxID=162169 RepID=A0ABS2LFG3_9CELL|nr:hypothetical protein [Oerskovia jenensis]MBM7478574.1 hypothetical protein [Oerskovia jenensis]